MVTPIENLTRKVSPMKTEIALMCLFVVLSTNLAKSQEKRIEGPGKPMSYFDVSYITYTGIRPGELTDKESPHKNITKIMRRNDTNIFWNWKDSTEESILLGTTRVKTKDLDFCLLPEEEKDVKKIKDDPSQYEFTKENFVDKYDKKGKLIGKVKSGWVAVKPGQIIVFKLNDDGYMAIRSLELKRNHPPIDEKMSEYMQKYWAEMKRKGHDPVWSEIIYEYRYWPKAVTQDETDTTKKSDAAKKNSDGESSQGK